LLQSAIVSIEKRETWVVVGAGAAGMAALGSWIRHFEANPRLVKPKLVLLDRCAVAPIRTCSLPYLVDGRISDPAHLIIQTANGIDVRRQHQVESIDFQNQRLTGTDLSINNRFQIDYDRLLLCPGSAPAGLAASLCQSKQRYSNLFAPTNWEEVVRLKALLDHTPARNALIVGGGYIGLEFAEVLQKRGLQVTICEEKPELGNLNANVSQLLVELLSAKGIQVALNSKAIPLIRESQGSLQFEFEASQQLAKQWDIVIVATGASARSPLVDSLGLRKTPSGSIAVDSRGRTSQSNVSAAGDCTESIHPIHGQLQAVRLARQAAIQGRNIAFDWLGQPTRPWAGGLGTMGFKLWENEIATTGLNLGVATQHFSKVSSHCIKLKPPKSSGDQNQGCLEITLQGKTLVGAQIITATPGLSVRIIEQAAWHIQRRTEIAELVNQESLYQPLLAEFWNPLEILARQIAQEVHPNW
jgi:NADPH-dependent 2,4-dienoyl-CoA reductase/sulfur reductase-like enzyme